MSISSTALAQDYPEPPKPAPPPAPDNATEMAGVGGHVPYAESGVLETGGNVSLTFGEDFTAFTADPMLGFFLWDNIQLSGILGFRWVSAGDADETRVSLMLEPSFHYPFTERFFGFVGVGGGFAFVDDFDAPGFETEGEVGLAIAPRAGVQYLVGRSGIVNLGFRPVFTLVDAEAELEPYQGLSVLTLSNSYDLQLGYTILF